MKRSRLARFFIPQGNRFCECTGRGVEDVTVGTCMSCRRRRAEAQVCEGSTKKVCTRRWFFRCHHWQRSATTFLCRSMRRPLLPTLNSMRPFFRRQEVLCVEWPQVGACLGVGRGPSRRWFMPSGLLSREQIPIPSLPEKINAKPLVPVKVPSDRVRLVSGVLPPSPAPPGRPSADKERHGGGPQQCIGEARKARARPQMGARIGGANQKAKMETVVPEKDSSRRHDGERVMRLRNFSET